MEDVIQDDFFNLDGDLLPCEFCEELFPMDILIQHQSGCLLDVLPFPKAEVDARKESMNLIEVAQVSSSTTNHTISPSPLPSVQSLWDALNAKDNKILSVPKPEITYFNKSSVSSNFENTLQQEDTKLMVYGSSNKQSKNKIENVERKKMKAHSTWILNNSDLKRKDQCDSSSDSSVSDDDESIEDFWQRAHMLLQRRLEGKDIKKSNKLYKGQESQS